MQYERFFCTKIIIFQFKQYTKNLTPKFVFRTGTPGDLHCKENYLPNILKENFIFLRILSKWFHLNLAALLSIPQ